MGGNGFTAAGVLVVYFIPAVVVYGSCKTIYIGMSSYSIKKYLIRLLISLVIGSLIVIILLRRSPESLTLVVCDVGQGDAILLRTTSGFEVLIDGGPADARVTQCLGKYLPPWDKSLELVVATHPDIDHIGGLVEVARRYDIGQFLNNGQTASTAVYGALMTELKSHRVKIKSVAAGEVIKNNDLAITFLWPPSSVTTTTTNGASVVMRVLYQQASVMLTGDMDFSVEQQLLKQPQLLKSDLLKVSHHGSRSATSPSWLQAVQSMAALISVGQNNRYGHPHYEVINRLLKAGVKVFRTDRQGDLVWQTFGETWQKVSP